MSELTDISLQPRVWELVIGGPPTVGYKAQYQYFIRVDSSENFSAAIYKNTPEPVFPIRYFVYKGDALAYLTKTANDLEAIDGRNPIPA